MRGFWMQDPSGMLSSSLVHDLPQSVAATQRLALMAGGGLLALGLAAAVPPSRVPAQGTPALAVIAGLVAAWIPWSV